MTGSGAEEEAPTGAGSEAARPVPVPVPVPVPSLEDIVTELVALHAAEGRPAVTARFRIIVAARGLRHFEAMILRERVREGIEAHTRTFKKS